jgi:hypothetical protein
MKKILFLLAVLVIIAAKSYSQSSCFAYMADRSQKILFISEVFDAEDFSGNQKDYDGVKWSIKEALKKNCKDLYGSQSYACKFEIVTKDADGHLLTNHYDANLERKKIMAKFADTEYKNYQFKVKPQ